MRFTVDASEVHVYAGDLAARARSIEDDAQDIVEKSTHDIVGTAQGIAPVDTGNLKSSIGADIGHLSGEAGPTADYGHYVEDGTSRMAPQPYMGPAFDIHAPRFEAAMGQLGSRIGRG